MIRLGQLLKLAGAIPAGGEAKALLATESVLVNGEREDRRGRQLHPGDVVEVRGESLRVVSGALHGPGRSGADGDYPRTDG